MSSVPEDYRIFMTKKLPTVEEICSECGYYHSQNERLAIEYHKSHGLPFKLVEGRIRTDEKHQCAGCERRISTSYRYCINCARTKG